MQVVCEKKECTFCSTNGFCQKDFVFIRPFGVCAEWYNKQGQPFVEQMSEALRKEFEAYDKRNSNNTESDMDTDKVNIDGNIDGGSDGGDKTADNEIKEKEEEVIGRN